MLIPLRNYSNYSICESNIKIDDLVNYAFENQLPAIALTDYKLLSGTLDFSVKCKKKGIQFLLSNNIKLAIKLNLDGIYIPSFNKTKKHLSYSFKKKFTLSTVINLLELLLKLIFLQNLLNRTAKISKFKRKHIFEVYYLANKKLMRRFNTISNDVYKKYFYIE